MYCILAAGLLITACIQCDKGTNPPPFNGPLELVYPKAANTTIHVGDTVQIRWSIHDTNQISSIEVRCSLDSGVTWPSTLVIGTSSHAYPDTTQTWIVSSSQISNKFVLMVRDYNNRAIYNNSSAFTVAPRP